MDKKSVTKNSDGVNWRNCPMLLPWAKFRLTSSGNHVNGLKRHFFHRPEEPKNAQNCTNSLMVNQREMSIAFRGKTSGTGPLVGHWNLLAVTRHSNRSLDDWFVNERQEWKWIQLLFCLHLKIQAKGIDFISGTRHRARLQINFWQHWKYLRDFLLFGVSRRSEAIKVSETFLWLRKHVKYKRISRTNLARLHEWNLRPARFEPKISRQ